MFGGHCPAVLGTLRSATPHLWQQGLGNGQRPRVLGKKGVNTVPARKLTLLAREVTVQINIRSHGQTKNI